MTMMRRELPRSRVVDRERERARQNSVLEGSPCEAWALGLPPGCHHHEPFSSLLLLCVLVVSGADQ